MLDTTKRYVSEDNLKKYTEVLNEKQALQLILTQADIKANTQRIDSEKTRAESVEKKLQDNIDNETLRAESAETTLDSRITDEVNTLNGTINEKETQLQESITSEETQRKAEINRLEADYTAKITGLDKAITDTNTGAIALQINSLASTLRSEFTNSDESLEQDITNLTEVVNTDRSNNTETFNAVSSRITAEVQRLDSRIVDHNSQYDVLNQQVQSHVENVSNPHNVTKEQLGAAGQVEFDSLEARVTDNEALSANNESRLTTVEPKVEKNIQDIEALQTDKVNYAGTDQVISGGLISDGDFQVNGDTLANGDVRVKGDLIVDGTHKTVDTETLLVQDNFVVVNSDNEELGTTPAGIAIQTGTTPYLIAYDIENKSVSLGIGKESNGTFGFAEGEKKPILTRANSNQLQDKHLLIWDANTNTAIDGGLYDEEKLKDTFATWTAYNTLVDEVRDNDKDIANLQAEDAKINANIDQIEAKDLELDGRLDTAEADIDSLEIVKQNVTDNTLKTTAKTIPTSINEVHDLLEEHEALKNNPHNVTWAQINHNALNTTNPLMDGVASPGTLTTVSRSDHVHPTDTTRAPVNHASSSTLFGVASTTEYGHVIVDANISDTSINPVQNSIVKSYVDGRIAGLDVSATELQQSETISSISETDGKISVTKLSIKIAQSQVTDLPSDLTAIRDNADRIETESKDRDDTLQDNIDTVQSNLDEEVSRAESAEATLQSNIDTESSARLSGDTDLNNKLNNLRADLTTMIDEDRARLTVIETTIENVKDMNDSIETIKSQVESGTATANLRWVLSFHTVTDDFGNVSYEPYFTTMDDGELS